MDTPTTEPKLIAQYELRKEIGRGGMSVVYEAEDTRTSQIVALKLLTLPPSLTPAQLSDLIARFRREARAVARLSHPNIVIIHEVGESEGAYFLAMERLTGYTLRDRLADGPLTPAQAEPIVTGIAAALDAVHQAGIVHRDVKPSNIMFLADGTAKLLDFGIARQNEDTAITRTDVIVGSPAFMSPEQAQGEVGTTASDVWALGVLAYQMLAGHPPFEGKNIPAVLYQVIHQPPASAPNLSPAVQKVLRRALDKNPERRPPTASAFAEDLRAALTPSNAPLSSPLPPKSARMAAWLLLPALLAGFWIAAHRRPSPPAVTPSSLAPPAAAPLPPRQAAPAKVPPTTARPLTIHVVLPVKRRVVRKAPIRRHVPRNENLPPRRKSQALRPRPIVTLSQRLPPRLLPRRLLPRPAPSSSTGNDDPQAAAHLQKFIWSEGR